MAGPSEHKDYHHGDLRNSLLAGAETLLRQRGAAAISLREVAKLAGVSHAAPYRHFRDKEELLQALATVGFKRLAQALRDSGAKYAHDPAAALLHGGETYVELAVQHPQMTQLMFGGVLSKENRSLELAECGESAFEALLELVDLGLARGIYRNGDRMDTALAAWSMMHGLSMLIIDGQLRDSAATQDQIRDLARGVGNALMHGLLR
jgi:AcrR family transcriptional regulator